MTEDKINIFVDEALYQIGMAKNALKELQMELMERRVGHNWTDQDVADAKAIKRMFPHARYISRHDGGALKLWGKNSSSFITYMNSYMFEALKIGETFGLDEIIGGEE